MAEELEQHAPGPWEALVAECKADLTAAAPLMEAVLAEALVILEQGADEKDVEKIARHARRALESTKVIPADGRSVPDLDRFQHLLDPLNPSADKPTLTITRNSDNHFTVRVGDRSVDGLCWDEALGQFVLFIHEHRGQGGPVLLTDAERAAQRERAAARRAERVRAVLEGRAET